MSYNYASDEKNKLFGNLLKIIRDLSEKKPETQNDINFLLENFILNFYDKPEINYKIISIAFRIKNEIKLDYEFLKMKLQNRFDNFSIKEVNFFIRL